MIVIIVYNHNNLIIQSIVYNVDQIIIILINLVNVYHLIEINIINKNSLIVYDIIYIMNHLRYINKIVKYKILIIIYVRDVKQIILILMVYVNNRVYYNNVKIYNSNNHNVIYVEMDMNYKMDNVQILI